MEEPHPFTSRYVADPYPLDTERNCTRFHCVNDYLSIEYTGCTRAHINIVIFEATAQISYNCTSSNGEWWLTRNHRFEIVSMFCHIHVDLYQYRCAHTSLKSHQSKPVTNVTTLKISVSLTVREPIRRQIRSCKRTTHGQAVPIDQLKIVLYLLKTNQNRKITPRGDTAGPERGRWTEPTVFAEKTYSRVQHSGLLASGRVGDLASVEDFQAVKAWKN